MNPKKLGVMALATAGLMVTIFLIALAYHWPFSQARIQQSLEEMFSGTVTFQNFRPTYFPHPGGYGDNLVFKQPGVSASTPPLVTIGHFPFATNYLDLFFRPNHLSPESY